MKKITVITITVFTSILLLALTYSLLIHKEGDPSADIIINIEHGDTLNQIKKKLMSEELIGSGVLFEFHVRLWRVGTKIKAGEYSLNRSYSISKIVEIITDGKSLLHKLTVPEGSSIKDIANLLDASPIKGGDDFIEFALSLERGSEYNFLKGVSLEGYLYPETYYFTRNATSKVVAEIMVKTFIEKVSSAIDDTIFNDKNRLHEIIT
ncbi:MAG: endolytic transglycosylase MltG, partial [Nitrospinota bacterium]